MGKSRELFKIVAQGARVFKPKARCSKEQSRLNDSQEKEYKRKCYWCWCGLVKVKNNRDVKSWKAEVVVADIPSVEVEVVHLEWDTPIHEVDAFPTVKLKPISEVKQAIDTEDDLAFLPSGSSSPTTVTEHSLQAKKAQEKLQARSVIKIQALARGRIIRRQAAVTLRCVQAVVRIQALSRGSHVRRSELGKLVQEYLQRRKVALDSHINVQQLFRPRGDHSVSQETCRSAFLKQLLECAPNHSSLWIKSKPNEIHWRWSWLYRWTAARPWEKFGKMQLAIVPMINPEENVQINAKSDTQNENLSSIEQNITPSDKISSDSKESASSITAEGTVGLVAVSIKAKECGQSDIMEEGCLSSSHIIHDPASPSNKTSLIVSSCVGSKDINSLTDSLADQYPQLTEQKPLVLQQYPIVNSTKETLSPTLEMQLLPLSLSPLLSLSLLSSSSSSSSSTAPSPTPCPLPLLLSSPSSELPPPSPLPLPSPLPFVLSSASTASPSSSQGSCETTDTSTLSSSSSLSSSAELQLSSSSLPLVLPLSPSGSSSYLVTDETMINTKEMIDTPTLTLEAHVKVNNEHSMDDLSMLATTEMLDIALADAPHKSIDFSSNPSSSPIATCSSSLHVVQLSEQISSNCYDTSRLTKESQAEHGILGEKPPYIAKAMCSVDTAGTPRKHLAIVPVKIAEESTQINAKAHTHLSITDVQIKAKGCGQSDSVKDKSLSSLNILHAPASSSDKICSKVSLCAGTNGINFPIDGLVEQESHVADQNRPLLEQHPLVASTKYTLLLLQPSPLSMLPLPSSSIMVAALSSSASPSSRGLSETTAPSVSPLLSSLVSSAVLPSPSPSLLSSPLPLDLKLLSSSASSLLFGGSCETSGASLLPLSLSLPSSVVLQSLSSSSLSLVSPVSPSGSSSYLVAGKTVIQTKKTSISIIDASTVMFGSPVHVGNEPSVDDLSLLATTGMLGITVIANVPHKNIEFVPNTSPCPIVTRCSSLHVTQLSEQFFADNSDAGGITKESDVENGVVDEEPPYIDKSECIVDTADAPSKLHAITQNEAHSDKVQSPKQQTSSSDAKLEQVPELSSQLPNYMVATQSFKAKMRTQVSPKAKLDSPNQKQGSRASAPTRTRHSPSRQEGKSSSLQHHQRAHISSKRQLLQYAESESSPSLNGNSGRISY